mmetsp:Transcript_8640/g.17234  ORF Transcript_8640/g.17234 Transcript_8640/m.17234 type:complete len:122 (+) Transcript_8640:500-865(+)
MRKMRIFVFVLKTCTLMTVRVAAAAVACPLRVTILLRMGVLIPVWKTCFKSVDATQILMISMFLAIEDLDVYDDTRRRDCMNGHLCMVATLLRGMVDQIFKPFVCFLTLHNNCIALSSMYR